ncbi:hypothetical protein ACFLTH_09630 [Bacteroidota bacterium]
MFDKSLDEMAEQARYIAHRILFSDLSEEKESETRGKLTITKADFSYSQLIQTGKESYTRINTTVWDKDDRGIYSIDMSLNENMILNDDEGEILIQKVNNQLLIPNDDADVKMIAEFLAADFDVLTANGKEYLIKDDGIYHSFMFRFLDNKFSTTVIAPDPNNKSRPNFLGNMNPSPKEFEIIQNKFEYLNIHMNEYLENQ